MKYLIYTAITVWILAGCEKQEEFVNVSYRVSGAYSLVDIAYLKPDGTLEKISRNFTSIQDVWHQNFSVLKGEIVYLSVVYLDSSSSVRAQIIAGGKVFKEASSVRQPHINITVSGVIPY